MTNSHHHHESPNLRSLSLTFLIPNLNHEYAEIHFHIVIHSSSFIVPDLSKDKDVFHLNSSAQHVSAVTPCSRAVNNIVTWPIHCTICRNLPSSTSSTIDYDHFLCSWPPWTQQWRLPAWRQHSPLRVSLILRSILLMRTSCFNTCNCLLRSS